MAAHFDAVHSGRSAGRVDKQAAHGMTLVHLEASMTLL
jgi:hypothetical protein